MRFRFPRRLVALCAAAGAAVLGGPSLPAAAQQAGPPELVPAPVPSAPLSPLPYPQKTGCMAAAQGDPVIQEKSWAQLTLGFEQAHEQTVPATGQPLTGIGQKVAVIDTGINESQPRLPAVDTGGGSSVPGGAGVDCDGHGTVVAGIIAAQPRADTGFVGVAPGSTLMSIRQSSSLYQDDATGKTIGDTRTMAQAIQYAVDHGASVINISQASCQAIAAAANPADPYNRLLQNAVHNAAESNVVVVAAAGNTQDNCQKNPSGAPTTAVLPAWFDEDVLTVASVGQQGQPSEFTVPGPWVDVAAPGENLTSIDPGQGGTGVINQISEGQQNQPGPIQGTSFAAPYVSGVAALIKQKYPQLTARQVMQRIEDTAISPGGPNGRNDIVGYGLIDPMAALDDVIPAEHGKAPAPVKPARLDDVIPEKDWAAMAIAFGGAACGIGAVLFTAFLVRARKVAAARRAGVDPDDEL